MNRRSWLRSALATIVLAVSDGIPKILAESNKFYYPPKDFLRAFQFPIIRQRYPVSVFNDVMEPLKKNE